MQGNSHPHRAAKKAEAEKAWGESFWNIVQRLASRGLSKRQVAELVGYSDSAFYRMAASEAPEIEWAPLRERQRNAGPSEEGKRRAAEHAKRRPSTLWLTICGRTMTAPDWAQETGLSAECIRRRYRKGVRGDGLIAPPMARDARGRRGMLVRQEKQKAPQPGDGGAGLHAEANHKWRLTNDDGESYQ